VRRTLVAIWVLVQVLLVVILCIEPFACGNNLGDDGLVLVALLLNFSSNRLGDLLLLGRMTKDGGAILCTDIRTLMVQGSRVMHPVKELDQDRVTDLLVGGVCELERFCMTSVSCANGLVVGSIVELATSVANACFDVLILEEPLESLLDSPIMGVMEGEAYGLDSLESAIGIIL